MFVLLGWQFGKHLMLCVGVRARVRVGHDPIFLMHQSCCFTEGAKPLVGNITNLSMAPRPFPGNCCFLERTHQRHMETMLNGCVSIPSLILTQRYLACCCCCYCYIYILPGIHINFPSDSGADNLFITPPGRKLSPAFYSR